MIKLKCQYHSLATDSEGNALLTFKFPPQDVFTVKSAVRILTGLILAGKDELTLAITEYKKTRTLTQNAYYWGLLNKLKNKLKTREDELHIQLLQRYGQDQKDENGNTVIFSLRSDISPVGILKYSKVIGTGTVNGVEFTHYKALKGSSEMDTAEMNVLIDGLISECKEVGIETDTPQELERLRGIWSEKQTEQSVRHTEEGQRQSLGA